MTVIRRGEIYWIKNVLDGKADEKPKRPALIVSEPEKGEPYGDVNIVYLTKNPRWEVESNVEIRKTYNGRCEGNAVMCNKIFWMPGDAFRPENFISRLSDEDMGRVDLALANRMGIAYLLTPPLVAEPKKNESEKKDNEIVEKLIDKILERML